MARTRDRSPKDNDDIAGFPVRLAALNLLDAVYRRGEPLDRVAGRQTKKLSAPDAAFALAIVGEAIRWQAGLDALIDGATERPLPEDAKARMVLRLALAQFLRLGTPAHAVIATALPMVEGGPRRLVHGVLSRLIRENAVLAERPALPPAVADRWQTVWGEGAVVAAEDALAAPPPVDLMFKSAAAADRWLEREEGVRLAPDLVRVARGRAIDTLPGYAEGEFWVQDFAASLPARLMGPGEGGAMLDLCAAPGGKTMQLAAAGWAVTAVDLSGARLNLLRDNLARTGLSAEIVQADLLKWRPDEPQSAILLDAPCSASGIFRRHPDVLIRSGERLIEEMSALQATLLDRAAGWLKPGGRLVYATCSLERAEGEERIEAFLSANDGFTLDPVRADELPGGIVPTAEGYLRTGPWMLTDQVRCDGFFAARLIRTA